MTDGEPETSADSNRFRGVEGLEDALEIVRGDAVPGIADLDDDSARVLERLDGDEIVRRVTRRDRLSRIRRGDRVRLEARSINTWTVELVRFM